MINNEGAKAQTLNTPAAGCGMCLMYCAQLLGLQQWNFMYVPGMRQEAIANRPPKLLLSVIRDARMVTKCMLGWCRWCSSTPHIEQKGCSGC